MKTIRPIFARLAWGAAVGLLATVMYRGIQYGTEPRAVVRAACWSWSWLPFAPGWIWPYLSMFVLVGLPWFMLPDLGRVKRFAGCLLAMAAVGWMTFLVHPTACVRPGADGQPFYYVALLALDRANNCLPCLHSALAVLAAGVLMREGTLSRTSLWRWLLAAWVAAICVSIVALRQHTDTDTLAGVVLGGLALGAWSYLGRPTRSATAA